MKAPPIIVAMATILLLRLITVILWRVLHFRVTTINDLVSSDARRRAIKLFLTEDKFTNQGALPCGLERGAKNGVVSAWSHLLIGVYRHLLKF